jgi:U3 small nucleolar RNA-associated protein 18
MYDGEMSHSPKSLPADDASATHASLPAYASKRKSAWSDPSDDHISVSLASDKRLRKLRSTLAEDIVDGTSYESKLRRKYEQINPVPAWAQNARDKLRKQVKRRRSSATSEDEVDTEAPGLGDLLRDASGILSGGGKNTSLQSGSIAIERLRDANHAALSEGSIASTRFHPSPAVPVMMTASNDRRLRLFTVRGIVAKQCNTTVY